MDDTIVKDASLTQRKHKNRPSLPPLAVVLAAGALVLAATACGQRAVETNPELEQARAKLTEAAAAGTPVIDGSGVDILGTPLAGSTLSSDDAVQGTVQAANATAQIADVRSLVKGQEPLATFTPDPAGPKPAGRVLYVRGGKFRTSDAIGGGSQELAVANADMPALFAPADDPGRAWSAPDGRHVAFFVGPDAEMWTMTADGKDNRRVSPANLPSGIQTVQVAGQTQDIRFRPQVAYTLVYGAGGDEPFAVLVDDNSRHVRGEGRVRVVHASPGAGDKTLVVHVNGAPVGSPMTLGKSTGDFRASAGPIQLVIKDDEGKTVLELAPITLAERELKTVFIVGQDELEGVQQTYDVITDPPATGSLVRVFNATDAAADVSVGDVALATGLGPLALGGYAVLPSTASLDARTDLEMTIYGLRAMERPVAWSPDGTQVAWLGAPAGKTQVFLSSIQGPARQLTDDDQEKLNPTWSPEGSALAWITVEPGYNDQTVAYLKDGKVSVVDTAALKEASGLSPTSALRFPNGVAWIDEDRLFIYPVADRLSTGIWVYDTRSGAFENVYDQPVANPDWSPTGQAWVFGHQAAEQAEGALSVLPLGATEARELPVKGRYPLWLPDGQRVSWVEGEPTAADGWAIHVIRADGTGDVDLTGKQPVIQADPPVPGPNPKRIWLADGRQMAFTKAGVDYGAREEAGFGNTETGNDIENLWLVPTDGSSAPTLASDLMKIFYLKELQESADGRSLGFVAFAYDSRSQQLYALPAGGGKPVQLDSDVRWFQWLP